MLMRVKQWLSRVVETADLKRMEAETQTKNKHLSMLFHLGQALNKLAAPSEILERISSLIGVVFDNRNLYIALYNEADETVSFPIYWMEGERRCSLESRRMGNGLTEWVIRSRAPLLIADRMGEAMAERGIELIGTMSRCYLGVPILIDDRVIGVIAVQDYQQANAYQASHVELLVTIASQAAIALENARLYEAIQQELKERKRVEEALREQQVLTNAIVNSATDTVWSVDPVRFGMLFFNNDLYDFFLNQRGLRLQIGMIPEEIFSSEADIEQWYAFYRRAIREGSYTTDYRVPAGTNLLQLTFHLLMQDEKVFGISVFGRNITEREQRENEMRVIASLSAALRKAPHRAEILQVIVEQINALLRCDAISTEIIDPKTGDTVIEAAHGIWSSMIGFRQPAGTGLNAIICETRQPYHNNQIQKETVFADPGLALEQTFAGAGVPLIAQDKLIGYLWMGRKTEIAKSEVRLLAAVADIAANALHRATLHEQTQKDAADLARAYDTTLEGWVQALELRDQDTEGHARRVVQMTVALARTLGIEEKELEHVRRGALLHDIGKMGIPDSILLKPGTLDEREWEIMQRHPEYAYQLLQPIDYLHPAMDIPYCHHEKWDGSGYPRGLKGQQIPLVARIFAVVDVWDALTSDRSYRKAWSNERAARHIYEQAGKHFDPRVVAAFLEMQARFGEWQDGRPGL